MAIKISIMNQKGGTGKSTTCSHLGAWLAFVGYSVLMIDMDPQGHLSVLTGTPERDGIFDLFVNGKTEKRPSGYTLEDVITDVPQAYHGGQGFLHLLPGNDGTATAAIDMQIRGFNFKRLGEMLSPVDPVYDFILFDNSPTVSLFTPAIMAATDWVLIPTLMKYLDVCGVDEIVEIMTNLAGMHNAQLLGILPTQCTPHTLEFQERMRELKEAYGDLVWESEMTTLSTIWAEASSVASPVFNYRRDHKAAEQAIAIGQRVLLTVQGVVDVV